MKNFIQEGKVVTVTAVAAMTAGLAYAVGSIVGVASTTVAIGEQCELVTEGVFELPKTVADVITQGAPAYLDVSEDKVTIVSTANTLIGVFTEAAGNGDTLARVKFTQ